MALKKLLHRDFLADRMTRGKNLFFFDEDAADRAVEFIETLCKHWKGEWAGQPFIMLDWQREIVRQVFGWKRYSDGTRRYRRVSIWVSKKNGKTFLAAAFALLLLFADHEPGAEVYSAAGDRAQAALVFEDAKQIVRQSEALARRCRLYRRAIAVDSTNSKYEVLSADVKTKHGLNIHGLIFDELHVQEDRDFWDTLILGVAARRQPLVVTISTAGTYLPESIAWEEWEYALKVRDGVIEDDAHYVAIFAADPKDDWTDPEVWAKANPSLGTTLKHEYLEAECKKAQEVPAKQAAFKRLHLGIWTRGITQLIAPEQWAKCDELPAIYKAGDICWGGCDLSSKLDITAAALVFPHEDETYGVKLMCWLPEEGLVERIKRDRVPYDQWAEQGYLTLVPGATIDLKAHRLIRKWFCEQAEYYDLQEIGFDPWSATELADALADEDGITTVQMRQGPKTMSEPTKKFVALVTDAKLRSGNNPILRWAASNLQTRTDENDNWAPSKKKSRSRIDPVVAAIMALGRVMIHTNGQSVYEHHGVRVIL